jgi:2-C-methyl-D-erythritol 2,4-cyclodiphosphate synthase
VGQGVDFHRLVADRPLWLGGIEIPFDRGLEGHSDGDALLHALADAILGALGEGDLGAHFPSSDESLRGIASAELLSRVVARMTGAGHRLANVDATILAQVPRLAPHQSAMRKRVAEILRVDPAQVNLKLTSTDGLGAIGREEGIGAQAVVLLMRARGEDNGDDT